MKKYDVNKEIAKYYKISMFLNKYILVLWSLLLSFVLMLTFNIKNNNVLAYTNSDILTKTLNNEGVVIWKSTKSFNDVSKNIKSDFLLTDSEYQKLLTKLWIWIFKDEYGIYYPMNININNIIFKRINSRNDVLKNYLNIISSASSWNYKFTKPKCILKTDKEVIKEYNLSCMETSLNNSIFCQLNKSSLIIDLINKNTFDITKNFYNKLFNSLNYTKDKKCNLIKQIYNKKYNLDKIDSIIENNNCNMYDFQKANEFIDNLIWNNEDLFEVDEKIPENYDVLMQKLIQQFYVLTTQDEIPDYMVNNNIKLIENIIKTDNMNSSTANIAKAVLLNLKNKESFRKKSSYWNLVSSINKIISWQPQLNIKWIDDYIKNNSVVKVSENNERSIIWLQMNEIISEREKVNNIFNNKYKNVLTITKKIAYDDEKKIANIEWFINLNFNVAWNKEIKKVKIAFDIKNIIWTNFDIYNVRFIDEKLANYVKEKGIDIKPDSLLDLKQILEDKLYAPLVNNDYGQSEKLSACDRYSQLETDYYCDNWIVFVDIENNNISPSLKVEFNIDNKLNINKINVNSEEFTYNSDNLLKEKFIINIWDLIKSINLKIKKDWYDVKKIWYIKNIINLKIQKELEENELKLSWMTKDEKVELNNKFREFLWTDIDLIRKLKWYYKIYFNLDWKTFYFVYDKSKNSILWIAIYIAEDERSFIFKDINIKLASLDIEQLNSFKLEPLTFLKEKDPKKYNEYQTYIKESIK